MGTYQGKQFIGALLTNPKQFSEDGKGYQLLQEYFGGFPVETLRPLLRSDDIYVKSTAAFIVAELAGKACSLIDDVVPLLKIEDSYIQSDVLDSVMVCSFGEHVDKFFHVVLALESDDASIRSQAMLLIANSDEAQLSAALRILIAGNLNEKEHRAGLLLLQEGKDLADEGRILKMVHDDNPMLRKYGAIASRRFFKDSPDFIERVLLSDDVEVKNFAQWILDEWAIRNSR